MERRDFLGYIAALPFVAAIPAYAKERVYPAAKEFFYPADTTSFRGPTMLKELTALNLLGGDFGAGGASMLAAFALISIPSKQPCGITLSLMSDTGIEYSSMRLPRSSDWSLDQRAALHAIDRHSVKEEQRYQFWAIPDYDDVTFTHGQSYFSVTMLKK